MSRVTCLSLPEKVASWNTVLSVLKSGKSQAKTVGNPTNVSLTIDQTEEDALKLQAEATAHALQKVAQGQQVLQDSMQQLEVRLRGAWLGHARQEFEALKVRGSQPGGSQDLDSHPEIASRTSPRDPSHQVSFPAP